jgi:hypothetical protein
MTIEEFPDESPDIDSPGPMKQSRGTWRRLFLATLVLIVVSGLSSFVAVAVDRQINGDDPEPLVILSAQEGKKQSSIELQKDKNQESNDGDRELAFQQRDLQFCSVVAVAFAYGTTKTKAAYNCGYTLGLLGCSATFCTIGVSKVKYFKARRQWRVDCYCT